MSATEHAGDAQAVRLRGSRALPEGPVEWTCKVASEVALIVMLVLIAVDIVTRSLFNFSLEVSDEVGGYMLVAIAFLSLSACHVNGSFHEVEFVQARLTARARSLSHRSSDCSRSSPACCWLGSSCGWKCRPGGSATWRRPIFRRRSGCRSFRWRSA